jgi:pyridoxal phosphate enzyme (YggS family)
MSEIAERIERVRQRIVEASERAGRDPAAVTLVAVSKRKPASAIAEAYAAGCRDFGENYSQELLSKAAELEALNEIRWHHIGHLQTNKIKLLMGEASVLRPKALALLHGVDRPKLLREIERRSIAPIDVLLQINLSGETTKSGCRPEQLDELLEQASACERLRIRGLMTMPPASDNPQNVRRFFSQLRELRDSYDGSAMLPELSMGMSRDFEVAIEEGATLVRVGTDIFGTRAL